MSCIALPTFGSPAPLKLVTVAVGFFAAALLVVLFKQITEEKNEALRLKDSVQREKDEALRLGEEAQRQQQAAAWNGIFARQIGKLFVKRLKAQVNLEPVGVFAKNVACGRQVRG